MIERIVYELEGHLNLELECFYTYEPEVPELGLNPREDASVELDCVYLGDAPLKLDLHLTPKQWREIEQYILEQRAWD